MRINFKRLKLKNFFSFGNDGIEYTFDQTGKLNFIKGEIGSGKSSFFIDGLSFALFGVPFRNIKKNQIQNSISNQPLSVEIEFEKNNDTYIVKRNLQYFEIWKNDILIELPPNKKSYQSFFEEQILEFDYNFFSQVLVKSSTKQLSFFNISKENKRQIINHLFSFDKYPIILENCKIFLNQLNTDLKLVENKLSYQQILIEQEKQKILDITRLLNEKKKESNELIKKQIETTKQEIEDIKSSLNNIKSFKDKLSKIEKINKKEQDLKSRLSLLKDKIELKNSFENLCGSCPTRLKIEKLLSLDKVLKEKIELEAEINKIESIKKEKNLDNILTKLREEISKESFYIKELNKLKNNLNLLKENKEEKIIKVDNNLDQLNKEYDNLKQEKIRIEKKIKEVEIIKNAFGDDGIKKFQLQKYLPIINKILLKYLQKFKIIFLFKFDIDFNEVFLSKIFEKLSYNNLSEGQKRTIDLCIILTFIEFLKIKSGTEINLIIFDEIISNLDKETENLFYSILKEIAVKKNISFFVISHTADDLTIFDNVIEFKKKNGFSYFEIKNY